MQTTTNDFINANGRTIAYQKFDTGGPGIIFLGGFKSDMSGIKALTLSQWCKANQRSFIRFDYSGHGKSSEKFEQGCVGHWLQDTLAIIDHLTTAPQILVGSSMGGWLMLLACLQRPQRIAGLLGIATAADFTESIIWSSLSREQRETVKTRGYIERPSEYQDDPYCITRLLIEDGRHHLLLDKPIEFQGPVRLLHGLDDQDVPWSISRQVCDQITSGDVHLHLIKDAEHRFSRQQDLDLILLTLEQLLDAIHKRQSR